MKEETDTEEDIEKQAHAVTSTEKEAVETELRRAVRAKMLMVLLLGCPLGYVASYWFQDWYTTGLLEYLTHADYVLVRDAINGAGELHLSWPNINPWVGIFVGSLIVSMLANGRVRRAQVRAKAILTGEEFRNANRRASQISFGKAKASDQTFLGALKQLLLLIPLALLILFGLIALLMNLCSR